METRKSKSGTKGVSPEGTELGSGTKQLAGAACVKTRDAGAVKRALAPGTLFLPHTSCFNKIFINKVFKL